MVETYWDDWCWSEELNVILPKLTAKQIELIPTTRLKNNWGDYWPPEAVIAIGEADDDPFRRLAAQIRGPGERLARQVRNAQ